VPGIFNKGPIHNKTKAEFGGRKLEELERKLHE